MTSLYPLSVPGLTVRGHRKEFRRNYLIETRVTHQTPPFRVQSKCYGFRYKIWDLMHERSVSRLPRVLSGWELCLFLAGNDVAFYNERTRVPNGGITLPRTTNPRFLLEASTLVPGGKCCELVRTWSQLWAKRWVLHLGLGKRTPMLT